MSAETKAALDAAIHAHVSDTIGGGLVTGYILQAVAVRPSDSADITHHVRVTGEQPLYISIGLAAYMDHRLKQMIEPDDEADS